MSETSEVPQGKADEQTPSDPVDTPFRDVQYGRVYDHLGPNQGINIAAFGTITIEIDEENLGLERISTENLQRGWERDREEFTRHCAELGIDIDPFEVYKYYQIQRKVFQVLGQPTQNTTARSSRFSKIGDRVKLSETKGNAMCSEYAILSTYIAQKIGEPVHLIVGAAAEANDEHRWREAHAYVWIDGLNAVFDSVLTQGDSEYPALMKPTKPATLATLESGKDIKAKRIGSNFIRFYGLEAGGFGVRMDHGSPPVK